MVMHLFACCNMLLGNHTPGISESIQNYFRGYFGSIDGCPGKQFVYRNFFFVERVSYDPASC